jgi:hypothetical protein
MIIEVFLEKNERSEIMKTNKKAFFIIVMFAAVFTFTLAGSMLVAEDIAALPGVTVDDEHPNGCVDCHVKVDDEKDYRLNVEVKKVAKHPPIDKMVKNNPDDCMKCHKEGSKAGGMSEVSHKVHFSKGKDSVFVAHYGGQCLHCHSIDLGTGVIGVKSGPSNW